jgi:inorganic pyrophosphatase
MKIKENYSVWHDVPVGNDAPNIINTIIEISHGSKNKYEIDKATGLVALDRVGSQEYPFDYGLVPQTYWEDEDPLDVVMLSRYPLLPGSLAEARPIAIMHMIDCGEGDDKLICVPANDKRSEPLQDLSDINERQLDEIRHFFSTYKLIDKKEVEVTGFEGKDAAIDAVNKGIKLYEEKFGKE